MPFKLKIFSIGKTKEKWLEDALCEYLKRLKALILVEFIWVKDNRHLLSSLETEKHIIVCDLNGKEFTSEEFADFLHHCFEKSSNLELSFVIGGSEGLPVELAKNPLRICLSRLTFTHQIARLILVEQVYRASQIWKGTPYHK